MKESRFYNLVYIVISVFLVFLNLLNKKTLGLPPVDYGVYAMIIVLGVFLAVKDRRFNIPQGWLVLTGIMAAGMMLNALVSKYSPGPLYSAVGGIITFMPFILFAISYNFHMSDDELHLFIRLIIAVTCAIALIVYFDTLVLHTGDDEFQKGIITSGVIFFGNFSSYCNQAMVLTLAELYRTGDRRWYAVAGFLGVTILLTNQMKAILGMMLVVIVFIFFMTKIKRWIKITIAATGITAIVAVLSVSAVFMLKFENYMDNAQLEESYTKVARPALYYGAFQLANDFFPFGSGQGTYGSVPVNIVGSRIYTDYELDKVWGLGDDTEFSFKMDAHWASIMGEMGYIGLIIYLLIFFYPARKVNKRLEGESEETRKYYSYIIKAGILTLFFESIVLALPKSFSFMVVYTGLAGLIFNRKTKQWTDQ